MKQEFFTDRDLGKAFPSILKDAGILIERHVDHFVHNVPDEEWLVEVGSHGWLAITHNKRIRYMTNQRDAVMRAGVGLFILVGHYPTSVLAQIFLSAMPKITAFLAAHNPPFIAKVRRASPSELARNPEHLGHVDLWLSYPEWEKTVGPK